MLILFLPPYSTELNPIEHFWSWPKRFLRKTLPAVSSFDDALCTAFQLQRLYTTGEQQKRVKIREIEIVYNFIGALDFEGAREQSQTPQDKNNTKVDAA